MPRGFTEQEKKNIRIRLIHSGKEAFGLYGIKKTSVDELAKNAGISKGAFYNFFPSKEDLYFAIIRHYETEQQSQMYSLLNDEHSDMRLLLKQVITNIMEQIDSDPFMMRLLGKDEFEYLWNKFTPEQLEEAMNADEDFAAKLIEIWRKQGKLKKDDPKIISGVFRGIFFLFLHKQDIGEEIFPSVVELLLDSAIEKLIEK